MIDAITHLLERPVAYHGVLAKALKSVPAAVMLSQGIYWQRKAEGEGRDWFWVTNADWYDQTGITTESQHTARKVLVGAGVWKEKLMGVPAKMHYQIDVESLVAVINRYLQTGIPVAVDYRSKKRQLTRTSDGKFRQQDAVENGNIIETKKDSKEITRENARAKTEKSADLKAEIPKTPPTPVPPPPSPAPRGWMPVDADSEIQYMLSDVLCAERFYRQCQIPIEQFPRFVELFALKVKSEQATHNNRKDFRSHFFSWASHEFARLKKQDNGNQKFTFDLNKSLDTAAEWTAKFERELAAERALQGR